MPSTDSRFRKDVLIATLVYLALGVAIYWPILAGMRYFWEDFINQEYPIREFAFTSIGIRHHIPLWNPYNWSWAVFAADPQTALWYPTNLLQIFLVRVLFPTLQHLPARIPEIMTLLHLPFAAVGTYLVARRRFIVGNTAALLAGALFGFGTRMVAEQNHQMAIFALAWLPWCTLFMLSSFDRWRNVFLLAIALGLMYLSGHPQFAIFNSVFLGVWALSELWNRYRGKVPPTRVAKSASMFGIAVILGIAISAIQSIPTSELIGASARGSLSYHEAGGGAITYGQLVNFLVPRILGENPGIDGIGLRTMIGPDFNHWEAIFSWTMMGEILALFAFVRLWKSRKNQSYPQTRYLTFFFCFSIFALLYALGPHLHFQWLFWNFVPLFGKLRGPSRMLCSVWFIGAIYAGIGLELLLKQSKEELETSRRFLKRALLPFIVASAIGTFGVIDLFLKHDRGSIWYLSVRTLGLSVFAFVAVSLIRDRRAITIVIVSLIAIDLFYTDFTWHRHTGDPQIEFEAAMHSEAGKYAMEHWENDKPIVPWDNWTPPPLYDLFTFPVSHRLSTDQWKNNRTKLLAAHNRKASLPLGAGMYLRAAIETSIDTDEMKVLNPMRLARPMPIIADSTMRMKVMGVFAMFDTALSTRVIPVAEATPFLMLYDRWITVPGNNDALLNHNERFQYLSMLVVENAPRCGNAQELSDSLALLSNRILEDTIECTVSVDQPSMLLVNDLYYHKWKALVDGKEVPIYRAFTVLRAVSIPKGEHRVLMYYDDASLRMGGWITSIAVAISLLGILFTSGRKRI